MIHAPAPVEKYIYVRSTGYMQPGSTSKARCHWPARSQARINALHTMLFTCTCLVIMRS